MVVVITPMDGARSMRLLPEQVHVPISYSISYEWKLRIMLKNWKIFLKMVRKYRMP